MVQEGQTSSEKKFYSPMLNMIIEDYQVETYRTELASRTRLLKQFNKTLVEVTMTWTWKRQTSRFTPEGYTFVKDNVKYIDNNGNEI